MQLNFVKPGFLARFCLSAVLVVLVLPVAALAQEGDGAAPDYSKVFDKIEVMIPARDGVKLHTEIYAPKDQSGPLPIILERRRRWGVLRRAGRPGGRAAQRVRTA